MLMSTLVEIPFVFRTNKGQHPKFSVQGAISGKEQHRKPVVPQLCTIGNDKLNDQPFVQFAKSTTYHEGIR
ncbi:hypothetical protein LAZ67_X001602 [Cordylochernes scorpioides]|uniref:Uncharacterized protein n=1 Tax=Cordylochernes scorpioides TaxID=51811 RepID=A0ABY6LT15_9ARAC|nr:hypothetical protein LAZ67_X001602 [Cordylochernes scorpioides]